jgi:hypothetical protein
MFLYNYDHLFYTKKLYSSTDIGKLLFFAHSDKEASYTVILLNPKAVKTNAIFVAAIPPPQYAMTFYLLNTL